MKTPELLVTGTLENVERNEEADPKVIDAYTICGGCRAYSTRISCIIMMEHYPTLEVLEHVSHTESHRSSSCKYHVSTIWPLKTTFPKEPSDVCLFARELYTETVVSK